ncbi:MAG: hypothetical protein ACLUO4_04190 [Christensenellales bacterium]
MKTRFIIGVILATLMGTMLYLGSWPLKITLYVFLAMAVYEVWQAFHHAGLHLSRSALIFYVLLLPVAIHFFGIKGILALLMMTGILIFVTKVLWADLTMENTAYTFLRCFIRV